MSYDAALDEAILAHIEANDLGDLATRVGEVFPTNLRERVTQLHRDGRLADLHLAQIAEAEMAYDSVVDGLPIPHPLDGDWRLATVSRDSMSARMLEIKSDGQKLLLGVPTVFQQLQGNISNITLIDSNPLLPRTLRSNRVITLDITLAEAALSDFVCVFADPPWYPDKLNHFVWFASASMAADAVLYLSVPGVLTRPSVPRERAALLELAKLCGLKCISIESHALRYESPPFERATLAAAGFTRFPQTWRTGDLLTFKKTGDNVATRPDRVSEAIWRRQSIESVDIRFRVRQADAFDPTPRSVATSSVRLDVTTRDPILKSVDMWTSGNQIFSTSNPALLADLAQLLNEDTVCDEMIESRVGRTLSTHERERVRIAIASLERIIFADATRKRTQRSSDPPGGKVIA